MGKYSKIAILFHWAIAILIGANILLATLTEDLPRAARAAYMSPHKAIGISILILTLAAFYGALAIALRPCLVSWVAFKRRQDVPRIFFSTF